MTQSWADSFTQIQSPTSPKSLGKVGCISISCAWQWCSSPSNWPLSLWWQEPITWDTGPDIQVVTACLPQVYPGAHLSTSPKGEDEQAGTWSQTHRFVASHANHWSMKVLTTHWWIPFKKHLHLLQISLVSVWRWIEGLLYGKESGAEQCNRGGWSRLRRRYKCSGRELEVREWKNIGLVKSMDLLRSNWASNAITGYNRLQKLCKFSDRWMKCKSEGLKIPV